MYAKNICRTVGGLVAGVNVVLGVCVVEIRECSLVG